MLRLLLIGFALALSPLLWASPNTEIANQVQQPPLRDIYAARQFSPLWLDGNKPSARAAQMLTLMQHADEDALRAEDYPVSSLQQSLQTLQQQVGSDQQLAAFDVALSQAAAHFISDLHIGRVNPQALGIAIDTRAQHAALPSLLTTIFSATDLAAAIQSARPAFPQYALLRQALATYRTMAAQYPAPPTLPSLPSQKLTPKEHWNGVPALTQWLTVLGDLPTNTPSSTLYDGAAVEGVKHFQQRHGQIPDGIIGKQTYQNLQMSLPTRVQQIVLAMERLRWLDSSILRNRFILINVPQFTLWAYAPDANGATSPILQMPVVVGKSLRNQTPLMMKNLRTVVFNPYWNVPRSIALKEILPKLDMDPFFLVHEDMEVVDSSGHVLGSAVSDAEYEGILHGTYRIRQRPGKKNALGELKFVFPNDDAIYMHDTPSKSFFAKERRDLSHGCVRVGNPMALALFALSGNGDWDEVRIKDNIASSTDKHLPLKNDIPVLLIYLTANVDTEGKVVFLQDIYQRDSKLAAALNAK